MNISDYIKLNKNLLKKVLGVVISDDKESGKTQEKEPEGATKGGEKVGGRFANEGKNTSQAKVNSHLNVIEKATEEADEEGGKAQDFYSELKEELENAFYFDDFVEGLDDRIEAYEYGEKETKNLISALKTIGKELADDGKDVDNSLKTLENKYGNVDEFDPASITTEKPDEEESSVVEEPETEKTDDLEESEPEETEAVAEIEETDEPEAQKVDEEGDYEIDDPDDDDYQVMTSADIEKELEEMARQILKKAGIEPTEKNVKKQVKKNKEDAYKEALKRSRKRQLKEQDSEETKAKLAEEAEEAQKAKENTKKVAEKIKREAEKERQEILKRNRQDKSQREMAQEKIKEEMAKEAEAEKARKEKEKADIAERKRRQEASKKRAKEDAEKNKGKKMLAELFHELGKVPEEEIRKELIGANIEPTPENIKKQAQKHQNEMQTLGTKIAKGMGINPALYTNLTEEQENALTKAIHQARKKQKNRKILKGE